MVRMLAREIVAVLWSMRTIRYAYILPGPNPVGLINGPNFSPFFLQNFALSVNHR